MHDGKDDKDETCKADDRCHFDASGAEDVGIDTNEYSGFAFGIGIERIAMLKYGINNIKMLFESDMRVLKQLHE